GGGAASQLLDTTLTACPKVATPPSGLVTVTEYVVSAAAAATSTMAVIVVGVEKPTFVTTMPAGAKATKRSGGVVVGDWKPVPWIATSWFSQCTSGLVTADTVGGVVISSASVLVTLRSGLGLVKTSFRLSWCAPESLMSL